MFNEKKKFEDRKCNAFALIHHEGKVILALAKTEKGANEDWDAKDVRGIIALEPDEIKSLCRDLKKVAKNK